MRDIRKIEAEAEKRAISSAVLADLPEWFGMPEYTKKYIEQSSKMPFWACFLEDEPTGFIALKETSVSTAEVFVMGVRKRFHRQGIGSSLFQAFHAYAKERGYEYLQVKTVDEGHYEEYDQTRLFYEKLGFRRLEVFPTLWDSHNPCLVLVMAVR